MKYETIIPENLKPIIQTLSDIWPEVAGHVQIHQDGRIGITPPESGHGATTIREQTLWLRSEFGDAAVERVGTTLLIAPNNIVQPKTEQLTAEAA